MIVNPGFPIPEIMPLTWVATDFPRAEATIEKAVYRINGTIPVTSTPTEFSFDQDDRDMVFTEAKINKENTLEQIMNLVW